VTSCCIFVALCVLTACGSGHTTSAPLTTATTPSTTTPPAAKIAVTSSAFVDNGPIPSQYTCDGGNAIVPLAWKGIPANTVSVAVVVRDPDAAGGFVHWIVLGLPPADGGGAPGAGPAPPPAHGSLPPVPVTARQLANTAGQPLWKGPCPPAGPLHHYQFTVYALNKDVQTLDEIAGAAIGQGTLVGVYRR
jgi:Raf kinase inhibitor-like YbhB/YbcL family protein